MSRNYISIFFSVLFLLFLTAPTIISMIDKTADVSIFYASAEEEKGKETHKDIELVFSELSEGENLFSNDDANNGLEYYFKSYPKPHLNLISPPPELHIL